jgi:hypothetical protein
VDEAVDVIAELFRLFSSRDWRAMRSLYHPSALIFTVTGGPAPLPAGAIIAELERASKDLVYSVRGSPAVPLDEHAAVVTGVMRRRLPEGGFEEAGHSWLLTIREGLIYRQGVYHDLAAASEAYASLGVTLGEADPS